MVASRLVALVPSSPQTLRSFVCRTCCGVALRTLATSGLYSLLAVLVAVPQGLGRVSDVAVATVFSLGNLSAARRT